MWFRVGPIDGGEMVVCSSKSRVSARLVRRLGEESGAELVEAAFVIPILLMLLLGIVWIGRAYNVYETITRAAREGDRYAVLPSCISCSPSNAMATTYTSAGTTSTPACVGGTTYEFTNYVSPVLASSALDPTKVLNYCQQAVVLNPTSDPSAQECGVQISFEYPVQFLIPFTSLNAATINIPTSATMRMENQPFNTTTTPHTPTCP
jgi:Flp pilus assembly protein TadG